MSDRKIEFVGFEYQGFLHLRANWRQYWNTDKKICLLIEDGSSQKDMPSVSEILSACAGYGAVLVSRGGIIHKIDEMGNDVREWLFSDFGPLQLSLPRSALPSSRSKIPQHLLYTISEDQSLTRERLRSIGVTDQEWCEALANLALRHLEFDDVKASASAA